MGNQDWLVLRLVIVLVEVVIVVGIVVVVVVVVVVVTKQKKAIHMNSFKTKLDFTGSIFRSFGSENGCSIGFSSFG